MPNREVRTDQTVWVVVHVDEGFPLAVYDSELNARVAIQETHDPEQRGWYDARDFRVMSYVAEPAVA